MKFTPEITTLAKLERGFVIRNYKEHAAPGELTARDLWNAWNTCLKYGEVNTDILSGGTNCSLRTDDIAITIHQRSGFPGSKNGLTIVKSDVFTPCLPGPELQNDILVLWDSQLSVAEFRGAIC